MKRFLKAFLIVACVGFCALGIAACDPGDYAAHSWSDDWMSNVQKHWRVCLDAGCNGRTDYEEHDWQLTTVYEAATCGEKGLGQYTCSVCKATLGNSVTPASIPATGAHDYELTSVDVEPTCGDDGFGSYICTICYTYTVRPIPATGDHDYTGRYSSNKDGHYHVCGNGCGLTDELQPHVAGEGIRFEPVGTQDGRIEYRCKDCGYLLDTTVIPNENVLDHFEVKFVKGSTTLVPELKDDGELYVTLQVSENAASGYTLQFTGYTASGAVTSVTGVSLYHYDEYTAKKTILDLSHGGDATTGYMGYIYGGFYVARATEDVSLWMECVPTGRAPVSLKVHIKAVKGAVTSSAQAGILISDEVTVYYQDKKNNG